MAVRVDALSSVAASVLPSYQDAIGGLDWLDLVAPYLAVRDYARLCAVNRRFFAFFAPRLWSDPLTLKRQVGLHPEDGAPRLSPFSLCYPPSQRESLSSFVPYFLYAVSDLGEPRSPRRLMISWPSWGIWLMETRFVQL